MPKIAFMGAGSTIFAKNVLGDCMLTPEIKDMDIALYDIDHVRLEDSRLMLENIKKNVGRSDVKITAYTNRKDALRNAKYVINAIQVGGYKPCTVTDFEIPKKYGLRQTIADTLGVGGVFRALRTIPVLEEFIKDMEEVCPDCLFMNYANPMAMLTGYVQHHSKIKTIGLCHSVQVIIPQLFESIDMKELIDETMYDVAGINHQAWLLRVQDKNGKDLYPEIKKRCFDFLDGKAPQYKSDWDKVRYEIMRQFGYYVTESSEHNAEYTPWFIKSKHPELIEKYNIPLDEYPRRCVNQINEWKEMRDKLVNNKDLTHERSREYASHIIEAMETDKPYRIHANVQNNGLIKNLPYNACVEVPCLIDRAGVHPCYVGDLPEQCAAINRTNINVQLMTIQAAHTHKKEDVYRAVLLDPHTAAELTIDEIRSMCDDLFEAHKDWMPEYK